MTSENKKEPGATAIATGVNNTVQNTPLHDTTPEIIMQGPQAVTMPAPPASGSMPLTTQPIVMKGRWIVTDKRGGDWRVGLVVDDHYTLLRVIPFGATRVTANRHAGRLAEVLNAQRWLG